MKTHLSYSAKDLYLAKDQFNPKKGFSGYFDDSDIERGFITVSFEDWTNKSKRVKFVINKLYAGTGIFGDKSVWVVELLSQNDDASPFRAHGCVEGSDFLKAINRAFVQVEHGYPSSTIISDYHFV